ncbi:PEP-CTERM sorting domain-containing protein [Kiritimatiellaeota bacterium B1221]|nr:PEP-CTERM sorting domain-containing protein [Kiritimatiellaeota bacterium B1221]
MKNKTIQLISLAGLLLSIGRFTFADTNWTGTIDDDIGDAGNWSNLLPSSSNPGTISNGDTVVMESRSDLTGRSITVSGGSTILNPVTNSGLRWGNSEITLLSGGHLDSNTTSSVQMGREGVFANGETTILNMYTGSTATFDGNLNVGRETKATINQYGGTMTIAGYLSVPEIASGVQAGSVYNLSGGSVTADYFRYQNSLGGFFNFTTGSTGTFTVMQSSYDFESFIDEGGIRLNGNASSDLADFIIDTSVGGQTTLTVIPEPGTVTLVGLGVLSVACALRRRK